MHVDTRLDERIDAIVGVEPGADRRTDTQRARRVLAGAREVLGFLEVLGSNHALEFEVVTDDEDFLDAVLVQQRNDLFLVRRPSLTVTRRSCGVMTADTGASSCVSNRRSRPVTMPTVWRFADHRHTGDAHRAREVDDLADRHVRRHRNRVAHDAALVLLDRVHLAGLLLNRHILVDDADTAFLGERNCEPRLGYRVHGGS